MKYDIKDISLAPQGKLKIEWAGKHMLVLGLIRQRFTKEKPFKDITIGAALHVSSETANLLLTLKEGGAEVALCACNPLSTKDDIAAALVKDFNISVFAKAGVDGKTYRQHLLRVLDFHPQITMDDGGDLLSTLHKERKGQLKQIIGTTEETTTGVIRLAAMGRDDALKVPVVAVNESNTKHMFDNRYGTGQSTIDGIMRATNMLLAGKTFVVAGYGWCGRGVAMRTKGMGANVVVTEVNPIRALEAVMDGYRVMKLIDGARIADIIVTATGDKHVIDEKVLKNLKDGAVLANTGHFNVEIDIDALEKLTKSKRAIREYVEEYVLTNGKTIYLLAQGRLVNLVAAEGHPAEVMDLSFANQALAVEWLVKNRGKLKPKVYVLPKEIDETIATLKLKAMDITIDELTPDQRHYLTSWQEGT